MAFATARDPWIKLSNSNTPVGPFQRIVFEFLITSANNSCDFGPISRPSHPSGISLTFTKSVFALLSNLSAIFASTASTRFTLLFLAFSMSSKAKSNLSSSQIEFPILPPCAFTKVYVIPPAIIKLSTFVSKFSIISILEDTLEPPMIAVKGRTVCAITFSTAVTSLFIK